MPRPRPAVLGLLGAAVIVIVTYAVWPAASQPPAPSKQVREQRKPVTPAAGQLSGPRPGEFDVRLEALKEPPPHPDDAARNPFRFYVKPPPPPPPPSPPKPVAPPPTQAPVLTGPPPPPPIPPIPLKFIGTMEQGTKRVAIFSDGRGLPIYGPEGSTVLGQYRVVRIGVESVVMEYLDGRGRQTIPMRGQ